MVSPVHVFSTLENLGFESFIPEVQEALNDCKAQKKGRPQTNDEIPDDELLRQQQILFEEARRTQTQLAKDEWRRVQLAAEQAQGTAEQHSCSSTQEDEEDNMWCDRGMKKRD